ncbi:MAG: hypothetical protein WBB45_21020 [Cyclobacteriaceae bacterium]
MTGHIDFKDYLVGHGDVREIAYITGFNVSYIRKVLDGQRQHPLIGEIVKEIATSRMQIRHRYNYKVAAMSSMDVYLGMEAIEDLIFHLQMYSLRQLIQAPVHLLSKTGAADQPVIRKLSEQLGLYKQKLAATIDWMHTLDVKLSFQPVGIVLWEIIEEAYSYISTSPEGRRVYFLKNDNSPSVSADAVLLSIVIRGLLFHLSQITFPDGRVSVSITESHERVSIELTSMKCLLKPAMFTLLNDTKTLTRASERKSTLESLSVAGHYIMALHQGTLSFTCPEHNKATISLNF